VESSPPTSLLLLRPEQLQQPHQCISIHFHSSPNPYVVPYCTNRAAALSRVVSTFIDVVTTMAKSAHTTFSCPVVNLKRPKVVVRMGHGFHSHHRTLDFDKSYSQLFKFFQRDGIASPMICNTLPIPHTLSSRWNCCRRRFLAKVAIRSINNDGPPKTCRVHVLTAEQVAHVQTASAG
jgi:hypothetical protein